MPAYTETEIIKGCCAQDRTFQEYLYKEYNRVFLKVCVRYAKDFHDSEQLLQDGFLKIFSKIEEFKHKGSFEGWMRRIMVNTCLDHLRSKQFKDGRMLENISDWNDAGKYQCEAEVVNKIALDDLVRLIQALPPMSKVVFNLFVFEGYPHKEIAEQLKISEGTSQWHVNNARKILQAKILKRKQLNKGKVSTYE